MPAQVQTLTPSLPAVPALSTRIRDGVNRVALVITVIGLGGALGVTLGALALTAGHVLFAADPLFAAPLR